MEGEGAASLREEVPPGPVRANPPGCGRKSPTGPQPLSPGLSRDASPDRGCVPFTGPQGPHHRRTKLHHGRNLLRAEGEIRKCVAGIFEGEDA